MDTTKTRLPFLALENGVVVPGMVVTVRLDTGESQDAVHAATRAGHRLVMVPRLDVRGGRAFADVGCVAAVEEVLSSAGAPEAAVVRGLRRARIGVGTTGPGPGTWVEVIEHADSGAGTDEVEELARRYRAVLAEILRTRRAGRLAGLVEEMRDAESVADVAAYSPELSFERKVELLETLDLRERLEKTLSWAEEELAEIRVLEDVRAQTAERLERDQREVILRRQLEEIRRELGESDSDAVSEYRDRIEEADMPEAARAQAMREVDRLARMGEQNPESGWIRTYLDTLFELPWGQRSVDADDLHVAREVLDTDHTGLDDVKDRIVEHLAVRKLRQVRGERAIPSREGRGSGTTLLLVGPPGVGKTSLGESIARALGRSFVRVALGGVRDEAEIRGHRRTYVGSRPGRVARALAEAGSMNPVFVLDEIDKVGADWRGDPSSALLEVLDPAQNHTFRDHYLEVDLDLSDVMFLATANVVETIPPPLLDRMEVVRIDGYTEDEKVGIARRHLLPRQLREAGLEADELEVSDDTLLEIVRGWTAESGVRGLERRLGTLARKAATRVAAGEARGVVEIHEGDLRELLGRRAVRRDGRRNHPVAGVATGLAVTGAGGEVLSVEASATPTDGAGSLTLTGQLGDVMKESAAIALSYVNSHPPGSKGIRGSLDGQAVHVHVPAGAVPKDGPSAGITIVTALASLVRGQAVDPECGMTGEVTLQGRVLPVGGVRQKLLAAHREGLKRVILATGNAEDLSDVPESVLAGIDVVLVDDVNQVLEAAFLPGGSSTSVDVREQH